MDADNTTANDFVPAGRKTLSPEHKAALAEGRRKGAEARRAAVAGPVEAVMPTRAAEVKAQRRRRVDNGPLSGMKLQVNESLKDPNFEYRIINDKGARILSKTKADDWDIVGSDLQPVEKQAGEGTQAVYMVGTDEGGQPLRGYLCRKPKEFYEEDKGKQQALVDAKEASIQRSPAQEGGQGLDPKFAYLPHGPNIITRGK